MSVATSLSKLKSKPEFLRITQAVAFTSDSSISPTLLAVWSTLSLLSQSSRTLEHIGFLLPCLCLVLWRHQIECTLSPEETRLVADLTRAAHATSASLACSSVLAGLSSESDEFADVAIMLPIPQGGGDRETEIVSLLGLVHWLDNGGKIVKSQETPAHIPSNLARIPQTQRATVVEQLDNLTSLLVRLRDPFEFRLEGGRGDEGAVVWLFLGEYTLTGGETVLVGLLGAGTWSDF